MAGERALSEPSGQRALQRTAWFVGEVAQNVAMALPSVRALAARRHTLGEESPADERVYETYRSHRSYSNL